MAADALPEISVLHEGYRLFWYDPVSATGLVEPMRTEDDHNGGDLLAMCSPTGIGLLADAGAERIKDRG